MRLCKSLLPPAQIQDILRLGMPCHSQYFCRHIGENAAEGAGEAKVGLGGGEVGELEGEEWRWILLLNRPKWYLLLFRVFRLFIKLDNFSIMFIATLITKLATIFQEKVAGSTL